MQKSHGVAGGGDCVNGMAKVGVRVEVGVTEGMVNVGGVVVPTGGTIP